MLAALTTTQFLDQLVNGMSLGMLYILVALGLNIILGLDGRHQLLARLVLHARRYFDV